MTSTPVEKTPMSTGYKMVFGIAIFILFANVSAAIVSIGDKASGGGSIAIFLWIYIIWKMWSRDNKALVSIFSALFWLSLIGVILGFVILGWAGGIRFANAGFLAALLAIGLASIFLMRFLREFFKKELKKQYLSAGMQ